MIFLQFFLLAVVIFTFIPGIVSMLLQRYEEAAVYFLVAFSSLVLMILAEEKP